jgi:subtilisin family serine protease
MRRRPLALLLTLALPLAAAPAAAAKPKHHPKRPIHRAAVTAPVVPNDPGWSAETGLQRIGLPALWRAVPEEGAGTLIAVVDTGVDATRPDLGAAVAAGAPGQGDLVGHGTAVAEVAAGRGNDGVGAAGVCWGCRILPVDVAPHGTATAADLAAGIRFAASQGAAVINLSLVLSGPDDGVAAAIAEAQAAGALVVAAAGNDGGDAPTYPAAYPGVVGVVAVDESDHLYPWSTHGGWAALAAPGCAVVGDAAGGVSSFCGSSAAAPIVSGLAGLLWPRLGSAAAVRAALLSTAAPLDGSIAAAGRVDAARLAGVLPR